MSSANSNSPEPSQRVALVIGATGLVGRQLVHQLLGDESYDQVRVFGRRSLGSEHPSAEGKLREFEVDFDDVPSFADQLCGDVLFSALGTTLARAGSQAAQWKVDHTYQFNVAEAASENGVPAYVLVSANGANENSWVFYNRMKGRLERDVVQLPFESIRILRPGLLDGNRAEYRRGERLALKLLRPLPAWSVLASVRPIHVATVARAARQAAADWTPGSEIIGPARLFVLGEE